MWEAAQLVGELRRGLLTPSSLCPPRFPMGGAGPCRPDIPVQLGLQRWQCSEAHSSFLSFPLFSAPFLPKSQGSPSMSPQFLPPSPPPPPFLAIRGAQRTPDSRKGTQVWVVAGNIPELATESSLRNKCPTRPFTLCSSRELGNFRELSARRAALRWALGGRLLFFFFLFPFPSTLSTQSKPPSACTRRCLLYAHRML